MIQVKTFEQLTDAEKSELILPCNDNISDYKNYQVRYNKKGELIGIKPNEFSEEKKAEIERDRELPDAIDIVLLRYGKKYYPEYYRERINAERKMQNYIRNKF